MRNALTIPVWLTLAATAYLSRADTNPRQPIDIQHYVFRLTLSDDTDEIVGQSTIDLLTAKEVTDFWLDLTSPAEGKGMTVTRVASAAGDAVPHTHESDRLHIKPAAPLKPGGRHRFTIDYRGTPASGLRIGNNK